MYVALRRCKFSQMFGIRRNLPHNLQIDRTMLVALLAMAVGGFAILFTKYVMPKFQANVEKRAAEQMAIRDAKRAEKQAKKDVGNSSSAN